MDSNLFNDKTAVKEALVTQMKRFRNISVKFGVLFIAVAFTIYFIYLLSIDTSNGEKMLEFVFKSAIFSLGFGLLGYATGMVISNKMKKDYVRKFAKEKDRIKKEIYRKVARSQEHLNMYDD